MSIAPAPAPTLVEAPPPSPFCTSVPTLRGAWDNTSLTLLKTCPTLAHLRLIEHWASSAPSTPILFGQLFHKILEHYDLAIALGQDRKHAEREAARSALVLGAQFDHPDSNRNRATLLRSVLWYIDHFAQEPFETLLLADGRPAVELSFRFELPITSPDGDPYIYCGHIDKLSRSTETGDIFVVDRKTTTSTLGSGYFDRYLVNSQLMGYMVASRIFLGRPALSAVIDAAQIAVDFTRFGRRSFHYSPAQLEEWLSNTCHYILLAEDYAKSGVWPMNDSACGNYGGCDFAQVCSAPKNVRHSLLSTSYEKHIWNPLENR